MKEIFRKRCLNCSNKYCSRIERIVKQAIDEHGIEKFIEGKLRGSLDVLCLEENCFFDLAKFYEMMKRLK